MQCAPPSVQQANDEVTFEGARALWVTFDPRCQVHRNATLSFFSDRSCRQAVMTCSGDGRNFRPFVVHGDTVYVRFRANNDEGLSCWGYRFHVSPMEGLQWLAEKQVLEEPSLELACWVLEFLLRDAQELVRVASLPLALPPPLSPSGCPSVTLQLRVRRLTGARSTTRKCSTRWCSTSGPAGRRSNTGLCPC